MPTRPPIDEYFLRMAELTSTRSTCIRRSVGCVLVNARRHVIGTGYNGVAMGQRHCIETPCAGAKFESGTGLDTCEAVHAEANALLQCRDVFSIETVYATISPCISCVKLLLNTSAERIVFREEYSHNDMSMKLWTARDRRWEQQRDE